MYYTELFFKIAIYAALFSGVIGVVAFLWATIGENADIRRSRRWAQEEQARYHALIGRPVDPVPVKRSASWGVMVFLCLMFTAVLLLCLPLFIH